MNDFDQSDQQRPPMPPPPQYYRQQNSGSKWWIPIVIILGAIGLFIAVIFGVIAYLGSEFQNMASEPQTKVTENTVLYLDLASGVPEYTKENPFEEAFGGKSSASSFFDVLNAISRASEDDRIKGIYIKPSLSVPMARAVEINEALREFKESGKFIYSFIEAGNESAYLSAITSDSIFMPVEGMLEMNGYGSNGVFFKGLMKKFGVEFTTIGFEDFKSAGESFSRNSYSDSAKYQLRVMLNHMYDTFLDEVSTSRDLNKDDLRAFIDEGHYVATDMMDFGLIDGHFTESEMKLFMKKQIFGDDYDATEVNDQGKRTDVNKLRLVKVGKYLRSNPPSSKEVAEEDKQIGIIYATGPISSGHSDSNPFGGGDYEVKSGDIVKYLKKAREDDDIKAIILRIDSPGGSVIASDEMWVEIQKTRKVKPVIASMSSVAASGGYYMAMACDEIIAHPNTITGSIGVILSIPNLSGMMDKLDVGVDTVNTSNSAQFLNGLYPFSNKDKEKLKQFAGDIYQRFVQKVADSRGMTYEETRSKAKGRVWMGIDAYDQGLVDELGGLGKALEIAKKKIDIDPDKLVYIKRYPEKVDSFEEFINKLVNKDSDDVKLDLAKELGMDPVSFATNWEMLPIELRKQIRYSIELAKMGQQEKALVAMPGLILPN